MEGDGSIRGHAGDVLNSYLGDYGRETQMFALRQRDSDELIDIATLGAVGPSIYLAVSPDLALAMNYKTRSLLVSLFFAQGLLVQAREIEFGGYTWTVRSGHGGPGPNAWDENNVWLDSTTNLHLKISSHDGKWSCSEITMRKRLGFGRYRFQTIGQLDRLDDNVVLGLFNYPTGDVGSDGTHEIDIEFARWGNAKNPMGNYTVWPAEKGLRQMSKSFPFTLTDDTSTHFFTWSPTEIRFVSTQGHRNDGKEEFGTWVYAPEEAPRHISQQPMPIHINLWLFKGLPPKNGQEVEVIIRDFKFTP